jgi:hypothetical protein
MRHSLIAGVPVVVFGAAVAAISATYPIGSIGRMGPGYLPLTCGIILVLLGGAIILLDREILETVDVRRLLRPTLAVFAGLAAWTLTVERFGLVVATVLMVSLVSLAQARPSWLGVTVTAAVLAAIGVVVFIMGLGIRLTAFGG